MKPVVTFLILSFIFIPQSNAAELIVADQIQTKLISAKNKKSLVWSRVYIALNKERFDTALKELASLANNQEFLDYYFFLSGLAHKGKQQKHFLAKRYTAAIQAGAKAIENFAKANTNTSNSVIAKKTVRYLAEVELLNAEIFLKQKAQQKAMTSYEKAFQKLSQQNLLFLASQKNLFEYARICEKKPNEICVSWEIKLGRVLLNPEQTKTFKPLSELKLPPVTAKTTSTTYKVDMDVEHFQKGFQFYLVHQYEEAYTTWKNLLQNFPRTTIKLRTKFWMARAAQKADYAALAETLYREIMREMPFSYYALVSSWFSNIEISRVIDSELPMASLEPANLPPDDIVHIRRAETFLVGGVPQLAQYELQEIYPRDSMSNEFLIYLAVLNDWSNYHLGTTRVYGELSNRNYKGLFSTFGAGIFFPKTNLSLIQTATTEYKVDPLLVLSVMKQESAFNSDAVSSSNAYGLLQIIAPTARDLDPQLVNLSDLFIPQKNIRLGAKYIQQLLNRYQGNIILAASAYNAGPTNTDRWLKEAPLDVSSEEFIELIKYRETHDYVQNVLRNYYWYKRRLKGEIFLNLESLAQYITPARLREVTARIQAQKNTRTPAKVYKKTTRTDRFFRTSNKLGHKSNTIQKGSKR